MNKINSNFSNKYRAWTLEEDEINVTLSDVPHRMTDEVLRAALSKFGQLDPADTVLNKCDLGFYNLERSIVFTRLDYDIPSFLKIAGYTIQLKYNGQPKTCMKCGTRAHMIDQCPLNTRVASKQPTPQTAKNPESTTPAKSIADAVEETVGLVKHHPGIAVNSPQFKAMLSKQLARFEELAIKRQEERFNEYKQHEEDTSLAKRKRSSTRGNDNLPDTLTAASDGFFRVGKKSYQFPQNSTKSKVPPGEIDYFDGENSYSILSSFDGDEVGTNRRMNNRGGAGRGNGDRRSSSCVVPSNAVRSIFSK